MSEMETVRGRVRLIETPAGTRFQKAQHLVGMGYHFEDYDEESQDAYDPKFVFMKGEFYILENVKELDPYGFSEVQEVEPGVYEFLCHWYNGGGSLSEVIEGGLNE